LEQPTSRSDIEARQLTKIFGSGEDAVTALDAIDIHIPENEFFTLLGPSGCGKTTLLRMIAGFEEPTSGAILLGGSDIAGLPPNRRPVNTVFQSYALFPHMTVAENIGFGLRMLGKSRSESAETVAAMLKLVRMEELAGRKPSQISGGQQQRVALARALAPQPRVLLLDEPLSALDLKLRKEMQVELKRLQAETGITFVFVTHDQEEALTMSDRIAVMNKGRVLQVGAPRDIYSHPTERFVANFIGDTNFVSARVETIADGKVEVRFASGATIAASLPDAMSVSPGKDVTVVIRPEHADMAPQGQLKGTIENIIYFGTDTNFHLRLENGDPFVLRRQNAAWREDLPEIGAAVSIAIAEGAVQVVRE